MNSKETNNRMNLLKLSLNDGYVIWKYQTMENMVDIFFNLPVMYQLQ